MLGERGLDAGSVAALDRQQQHRARGEQRARLVDDQREHLVTVRGGRARRRHAACAIERAPGGQAALHGTLERAGGGHGERGGDARRDGADEHDGHEHGRVQQQRPGGGEGGTRDRARKHEQSGTRNRAAPPRDTRERDGESHASGPAEKRRERCGQAQPVAHDVPLPTIAPRYHARRAFGGARG